MPRGGTSIGSPSELTTAPQLTTTTAPTTTAPTTTTPTSPAAPTSTTAPTDPTSTAAVQGAFVESRSVVPALQAADGSGLLVFELPKTGTGSTDTLLLLASALIVAGLLATVTGRRRPEA